MKQARLLGVVLIAAVLGRADASARETGAIEFGLDAGLDVTLLEDVENLTTVDIPSRARVGFQIAPEDQLQTSFDFSLLSSEGDTIWDLIFGLDYLHDLTRNDGGPFLRAGGRLAAIGLPARTHSQFGLGAGIGTRVEMGTRWATRFEAGVDRFFETDDLRAHTDVGASIGVSFFTR